MAGLFHSILALILYAIAGAIGPIAAPGEPAGPTLIFFGGLLVFVVAAGMAARHRALRLASLGACGRARRRMAWLALAAYGALVTSTPWVGLTTSWIPPDVPMAAGFLGVLPYALFLIAAPLPTALAEQRLAGARPSVRVALGELRPQLVLLLGLTGALGLSDVSWHFPTLRLLVATDARASAIVTAALFLTVLLLLPLFVRFLWRSTPLPAGPLRTRLEALAREAKVSYRNILVPHTGTHPIINAWISGIIAPVRYFFITEAMLRELSEDEVAQVFAHELGHARLHHFIIYLFVASVLLFTLLAFDTWITEHPLVGSAALLCGLCAYLAFFFSRLSRRLESHADLFAAGLTGSPGGYLLTMARIAGVTGGMHTRSGWLHYSIPDRMEIVARSFSDARYLAAFRRRTRRLLLLLLLMNIAAMSAYGLRLYEQSRQPVYALELAKARALRADGEERAARAGARPEIIDDLYDDALAHYGAAEADLARVKDAEADRALIFDEIGELHELRGDPASAARAHQAAERLRTETRGRPSQ